MVAFTFSLSPSLHLSLSPSSLPPPLPPSFLQCHNVLGDFEDDIVELFGDGLSQDDIIDELCYSISGKAMQDKFRAL